MFIGWFIHHSRLIGLGLGRWKDQGGVYLVEGVFGNSGVSGVWFFASLARGGVLDIGARRYELREALGRGNRTIVG